MTNSNRLPPRIREIGRFGGRIIVVAALVLGVIIGISLLWLMWYSVTQFTQLQWTVIVSSLVLIVGISGLIMTALLLSTVLTRLITEN